MSVRVCPSQDRECGSHESGWCCSCPKRTVDPDYEIDAKRYRWLRDQRRWAHIKLSTSSGIDIIWENHLVGDNKLIDEAIDAGMEHQSIIEGNTK